MSNKKTATRCRYYCDGYLARSRTVSQRINQPHPVEAAAEISPLLNGISVINAGLRSFADDLQSVVRLLVVHYQWAPVAGGNKKQLKY